MLWYIARSCHRCSNVFRIRGEIICIRVGTSALAILMLFGMTELPVAKIVKVVTFNPIFTYGLFVLCVLKYWFILLYISHIVALIMTWFFLKHFTNQKKKKEREGNWESSPFQPLMKNVPFYVPVPLLVLPRLKGGDIKMAVRWV